MDRPPQFPWEPVTPRGVAAFAHAKLGRLLIVQLIIAILTAAALLWLLRDGYFPTIAAAIDKLPDKGEIRSTQLNWPGEPKQLLAESRFIAFNVNLEHSAETRSPAHVQIQFGRDDVRVYSILNYYAEFEYPPGWAIAFNRLELGPKWGAWRLPLSVLIVAGMIAYLIVTWTVLATIYAVPVWLWGYYLNRDLSLGASWKLSGAALMPGALLMAIAFLLYDFGLFDLVALGFVAGAHFILGWVYLGVSPLFVPRHPAEEGKKKNPFTAPSASQTSKRPSVQAPEKHQPPNTG